MIIGIIVVIVVIWSNVMVVGIKLYGAVVYVSI